jgi:hypothetical protein
MSSIINKVKEALHHDHSTTSGSTNTATGTTTTGNNSGVPEGTAGPHSSRVANAADPRIDSDMDHRGHNANSAGFTGTTGNSHNHGTSGLTGTTGTAGTGYGSSNTTGAPQGTAGPHSSRLANTVDPRVDSDRDHRANPNSSVPGTTGTTHNHGTSGLTGTSHTGNNSGVSEGVAGPHSSRVANAVDPRVDSDADHRANPNSGFTGTTGTTHNHGTTGNSGLTGNEYSSTTGQPQHSSNLANKLDPRVDSTTTSGSGNTSGFTGTNPTTTGLTGSEYGSTTGQPQHSSNLANKVDPRVDSSTSYGMGQTNTASTLAGTGDRGGLSNSTNAGPHNSNIANKVDPRVDSDLDSTGNRHGASHGGILGSGSHATAGSGTAQNTQGPHNSDLMNKLDPRVDADGDGSRTYGGNKTHA